MDPEPLNAGDTSALAKAYSKVPANNANIASTVLPTDFARYYVGSHSVGQVSSALFREGVDGSTNPPTVTREVMLEGVLNMQLTYAVDTDGDGVADMYVPANLVETKNPSTGWNGVVAVRIGLLVQYPSQIGFKQTGNQSFTVNEQDVAIAGVNDAFIRRVYETTISLGNDL